MRILALSGSLGARSSNTLLLKALQSSLASGAKGGIEIAFFESLISDLPYFNPDLDRQGDEPPPAVNKLRTELASSGALLISTPEYAHGIPGVLKNALDWLVSGPEMIDKPVGLILGSASSAEFARSSLTEILRTMSARVVPEAVLEIPGVRTKIDENGQVKDERLLAILRALAGALVRGASEKQA